ncbi:hypothetical protein ABIE21_000086 [Conyzicola nivalis]|uniref:Glycolipid-binding domain-containing protein n=1 Tax=Conyzicola nivalis TaxID=1477021 RepID=A0ABV2QHR9_9MICO
MMQLHWIGTDTVENTTVTMSAEGSHADGQIDSSIDDAVLTRYSIDTDASWATRFVRVATEEGDLVLIGDGLGGWTEGDGTRLDHLAGAIDVDITATPLTNTLPIWRLGLRVGESADVLTAYIDVPQLTVIADPQRYRRLDERSYRFESQGGDFARDITIDDAGFVVDYPGLFRRA